MLLKLYLNGDQIGAYQISSYTIQDSKIHCIIAQNAQSGLFDPEELVICNDNDYFFDLEKTFRCEKIEISESNEIIFSKSAKMSNESKLHESELICEYCGAIYAINSSICPVCNSKNDHIIQKDDPRRDELKPDRNSQEFEQNDVTTDPNATKNPSIGKSQNQRVKSGDIIWNLIGALISFSIPIAFFFIPETSWGRAILNPAYNWNSDAIMSAIISFVLYFICCGGGNGVVQVYQTFKKTRIKK